MLINGIHYTKSECGSLEIYKSSLEFYASFNQLKSYNSYS